MSDIPPLPEDQEPLTIENAFCVTWEVESNMFVMRLWRQDNTPFAAAVFPLENVAAIADSMRDTALLGMPAKGPLQ